jgi:hypothetical protein
MRSCGQRTLPPKHRYPASLLLTAYALPLPSYRRAVKRFWRKRACETARRRARRGRRTRMQAFAPAALRKSIHRHRFACPPRIHFCHRPNIAHKLRANRLLGRLLKRKSTQRFKAFASSALETLRVKAHFLRNLRCGRARSAESARVAVRCRADACVRAAVRRRYTEHRYAERCVAVLAYAWRNAPSPSMNCAVCYHNGPPAEVQHRHPPWTGWRLRDWLWDEFNTAALFTKLASNGTRRPTVPCESFRQTGSFRALCTTLLSPACTALAVWIG